jgi:hypothetical protein
MLTPQQPQAALLLARVEAQAEVFSQLVVAGRFLAAVAVQEATLGMVALVLEIMVLHYKELLALAAAALAVLATTVLELL